MLGINPFQPYGGFITNPLAFGMAYGGINYPTLDNRGIPFLSTNAVQVTEESVDFGINPCLYKRLPDECVVLLKIRNSIPDSGANLPVTVATPASGSSTVGSSSGVNKVPVVDHQNTPVTGANLSNPTERWAYLNKCTGTLRLLEFATTAPANNAEAPAVQLVKSSK